MRLAVVGAGPAGLLFAILAKAAAPADEVLLFDGRQTPPPAGAGFALMGSGLEGLARADAETHSLLARTVIGLEGIEVHLEGQVIQSANRGLAAISRRRLLEVLAARARELGVAIVAGKSMDDLGVCGEADLLVAADGAASFVRHTLRRHFEPSIEPRPVRRAWLGTSRPSPACGFLFARNEYGLWRGLLHGSEPHGSSLLVECDEDSWLSAGLESAPGVRTASTCQALFSRELQDHTLVPGAGGWRRLVNVSNRRWWHGNVVLLGDAARTHHLPGLFGLQLVLDDALALAAAIHRESRLETALASYEAERRQAVRALAEAQAASREWFTHPERYLKLEPCAFGFSLLCRGLGISHHELGCTDPALVTDLDRRYATQATAQSQRELARDPPPPPMFTPYRLRGLTLANRVVVAPFRQQAATSGTVGDWHLVNLASHALGGAGLLFTDDAAVSTEGRVTPRSAGLYAPEHASAWKHIVDFFHRHSAAKIGLVLSHAGRKGATRAAFDDRYEPLEKEAWPLLAASPLPWSARSQSPSPMDREDMDRVMDDFVCATLMAEQTGFDMLELEFAHGFLLASFISPITNRREDQYGGGLGNRLRYPLEVLDAVRTVWPEERPLAVRYSASDRAAGGTTPDEAVKIARVLCAHGCDVVHVSAGGTVPDETPRDREESLLLAERTRLETGVPTMAVGELESWDDVNSLLVAGGADLFALGPAHLHDPGWARRAAREQRHAPNWSDPFR